VQQLLDD